MSKASQSPKSPLSDTVSLTYEMPDSVVIRCTGFGKGIFVTKSFKKGELVYSAPYFVIPNETKKVVMRSTTSSTHPEQPNSSEILVFDTLVHSVQLNESERALFTFDALMNHSCNPSTFSAPQTADELKNCTYRTIAARDINAGEEITCDYELFEYDCADKGINQCACGYKEECRGTIHGFKYWPLEKQIEGLPLLDHPIRSTWLKEEGRDYLFLESNIPQDVAIDSSDPLNWKLITTKPIKKGSTLFHNTSYLLDTKTVDCDKILQCLRAPETSFTAATDSDKAIPGVTIDVQQELFLMKLLNRLHHTVSRHKGRFRETYGFDTFVNHSCEPNSQMVCNNDKDFDYEKLAATHDKLLQEYKAAVEKYGSKGESSEHIIRKRAKHESSEDILRKQDTLCKIRDHLRHGIPRGYKMVALRDMEAGEEITCDYSTFDDEEDGWVLDCTCGSSKCKGQIRN